MAKRDHSLDQKIVDAARAEFMEHGFQKASLHKIAQRAGLTTGALYTRYRSKDDLFCSLVGAAMEEVGRHLAPIEKLYMEAREAGTAQALLKAIHTEEEIYLELLTEHYDACVLLLCRSAGSSLAEQLDRMMGEKARQTVEFFRTIAKRDFDLHGVEIIMSEQLCYFRQVLQRDYTPQEAVSCMRTVDLFLEAGWKAILELIL